MTRAWFFDLDGTIADTEPLHLAALRKILAAYDLEISDRAYADELLPLSYREVAERLLARAGQGAPPDLLDQVDLLVRREARQRMIRDARPLPGAAETIEAAAARGPVAIVTSTARSIVEPLLIGWAMWGRFDTVVCGGDTDRGKPAPDPYRVALDGVRAARGMSDLAPAQCEAFEDTPHGIQSAHAAGMRVTGIAVTLPRDRLATADRVVDRLDPSLIADPE